MAGQLGFTTMLDAMEFMRKSWGQLNLPGALTPTMDLDELDRRIKDLKAVEQWLNVNMSMLRSSIQTLEVQRGTIAALQSFGNAMTASATAPTKERRNAGQAGASGSKPAASRDEPAARADVKPSGASARTTGAPARTGPESGGDASTTVAPPQVPADAGSGSEPPPATGRAADAPLLDPTAWWNLLQQQFQQVAGSALAGVTMAGMTPAASAAPAEKDAPDGAPTGRVRGATPTRGASPGAGTRRVATRSAKRNP